MLECRESERLGTNIGERLVLGISGKSMRQLVLVKIICEYFFRAQILTHFDDENFHFSALWILKALF